MLIVKVPLTFIWPENTYLWACSRVHCLDVQQIVVDSCFPMGNLQCLFFSFRGLAEICDHCFPLFPLNSTDRESWEILVSDLGNAESGGCEYVCVI